MRMSKEILQTLRGRRLWIPMEGSWSVHLFVRAVNVRVCMVTVSPPPPILWLPHPNPLWCSRASKNTRTHPQAHIHTNKHVHAHAHASTHIHAHTHTHANIHIQTHAHTQINTYTPRENCKTPVTLSRRALRNPI